ncbi:hypothetical protein LDENG_00243160 [Lucifuga dentata]|nr:hypothetical protein LDENG_00243160 [Lucifuga dentata]
MYLFQAKLSAAVTSMAPLKFVIKCGNFAVLVDLHVLPLGGQEDTSWFTVEHIEEVTTLVRDAVEQRVKQYTESLHSRNQPKQKELAPTSALFMKGRNFSLVANFLKRHFNLRCIVKQLCGELRVFPERYVVCVSCPKDASAHHGNPSPAATELSEQSRSEYFSRAGETQEPPHSPMKTKKTVLQKMAKQAGVHRKLHDFSWEEQQIDQGGSSKDQRGELGAGESELRAVPEARHQVRLLACPTGSIKPMAQAESVGKQSLPQEQQTENRLPDSIHPNEASIDSFQHKSSQETRKRFKMSNSGEEPHPQRPKRTCLGRPPASTPTHPVQFSSQESKCDLLPLPPLPPAEVRAESKAFPASECKKTTLEVELLTPGKWVQRLPLASNNTAQTNQNRLATSLRGLSVKPASSGSSISSRSTHRDEGSENVPRTSRLRRLKRS